MASFEQREGFRTVMLIALCKYASALVKSPHGAATKSSQIG